MEMISNTKKFLIISIIIFIDLEVTPKESKIYESYAVKLKIKSKKLKISKV